MPRRSSCRCAVRCWGRSARICAPRWACCNGKWTPEFVNEHITAAEFERRHLRLVKDDPTIHGEPAFGIIDSLFYYVDEYFDDPDFTDEQRKQAADNLRDRAREALAA